MIAWIKRKILENKINKIEKIYVGHCPYSYLIQFCDKVFSEYREFFSSYKIVKNNTSHFKLSKDIEIKEMTSISEDDDFLVWTLYFKGIKIAIIYYYFDMLSNKWSSNIHIIYNREKKLKTVEELSIVGFLTEKESGVMWIILKQMSILLKNLSKKPSLVSL